MYKSNLALLACPVCQESSANLDVLTTLRKEQKEMIDALIECASCGRIYLIEDGVADLVRDGVRDDVREKLFLEKYRSEVDKVDSNISDRMERFWDSLERSDEERRILEEGLHWGRFMRRFWDVGDRSIFDLRSKGSHPPFYVKGVLEPDDRDSMKEWGVFANDVGDFLFARMHQLSPRKALDIGCGGGQFGLEAACQGLHVIGMDPGFEAIALARKHAREQKVKRIDYVRGEPSAMPFKKATFDLLMAKDSLHHVPDLSNVFPHILSVLTKQGLFVCHEHVSDSKLKQRVFERLGPWFLRKIGSRYPHHPIPDELLQDSANEDVSADQVVEVLNEQLEAVREKHNLFLKDDLELYVYFAFGKRKWFIRLLKPVFELSEYIGLWLGDRQHYSYWGRSKSK